MSKPSLRQIAKELDISPASLSYMVNGKRPWRKDLFQRYMGIVNTFVNTKPKSSGPGLDLNTKLGPRSGPHLHGVQGAPGSNPGAPTIDPKMAKIEFGDHLSGGLFLWFPTE